MKRIFISILMLSFLSVAIVGCGKKGGDPELSQEEQEKIDKQKDEAVKAVLVGKWQSTNFDVDGYKGGKLVNKVTDADILAELQKEMTNFIEFTQTSFILVDLKENIRSPQSYTLDAKTAVIVVLDDQRDDGVAPIETHMKYTLSANQNDLTVVIVIDEDFGVAYDALHVKLNLKRIANWPAL